MLKDYGSVHARNIILTAAAFWVAGAMTGRGFEATPAIGAAQTVNEILPQQARRIQGNLHGMLGLKFEEHILQAVNTQVRVTLGTFPKVTPEAVAKTADDATKRLASFLEGWKFEQSPSYAWSDNNSKARVTFGLQSMNINAIVRPNVIARVKTVLNEVVTRELNRSMGAAIDPALIGRIAMASTTGATTGFGEWVCIFNPETGATEWFNQETGEWGGDS